MSTSTCSNESTKVQNPRRILHILRTMPMRVRGNWPRLALLQYAWCCQFLLQHGLAAAVNIVLGKAECC